jgi:hemerythrin
MQYSSDFITWSGTFACGIRLIDDQHKELINLVNEMFCHATGNDKQEREYFSKVIQKAVRYIKVHFATEEKIMRAMHYPDYAEHKKHHDHFILEVLYNIREYETEKHYTLFSFTKYLKDWILSHIGVVDKQYFLYVKRMIATLKIGGRSENASVNVA